ncbi:hypothetical protein [Brachybacterium kimchii]|uniref:DNA polymerase III beta sliding clamp central domain-containing protein n=1 Tax=Brachybacterium kimchii TaxID=2942909 RepID=A0ABY4NDM6_9MICO|nr:hypothetical protein [Brachybacterium kimchii]UQN31793.1 hypothetical protein M4486_19580 [Brachybacterium kimchii]
MPTITTAIDRLRKALDATIPFASSDDTTPVLNGVHIQVQNERLQFSSSDRYAVGTYRLHRGEAAESEDEFTADDAANELKATIPLKTAKEVLRTAKSFKRGDALEDMRIEIEEHAAVFTFPDGTSHRASTIDSEFPPLDRLFPSKETLENSTESSVIFNPGFAAKVNKTAAAISERNEGVQLRITSALKPAVYRLQNDEHWSALLMPMRG